MTDRVAQMAAALDRVAAPVGLDRLETLGLDISGAYEYYAVRLRRGTIFAPYELDLARALLAWPGAPAIAHEIGGGYGGLSILLAALGFKATSLEFDVRRHAGAMALLESLHGEFPGLRDDCRMINARFPLPPGELPTADAMAVITNLVSTTTPRAKAEIVAALTTYRWAVIDVDRFLVQCHSAAERAARLAEFASAGLTGEPFLDLGANACLYRFTTN
ncbi:MAG: hypothetical protein ACR2F8_00990 [Caulobacteraceae bacterium]